MARIGVIGGGAWGTTLALVASRAGKQVQLWAREADVVEAINARHENPRFLSGVKLDPTIKATGEIGEIAESCELVAMVAPAQHVRTVAAALGEGGREVPSLLICAKGIERATGLLMSEVLADVLPDVPRAVLSGPTFAREVAMGKPTAVTVAADDASLAERMASAFGSRAFRPYVSDDVVGAQIGGAMKNVLAIAAGIAIGRGLGENARAALITRGFAELSRLALKKGARLETLGGLSGLGDLVLTCTSDQSRNYALGKALGEGATLEEHMASRETVAEGAASAPAVLRMAQDLDVELPIAEAVNAVLYEGAGIDEAIGALLARPFKAEA